MKSQRHPKETPTARDHETLNALLVAHLAKLTSQQELDLRWKNIRFFLMMAAALGFTVVYLLVGYFAFNPTREKVDGEYASLIKIQGVIDAESKAAADKLNPALVRAFKDVRAKGVVLLINSPGGSPVQSSLIYERIRELRGQYPDKRVVAVAQDMLTSGAYFIAAAADMIYVNPSTITGSIGVISTQFGFPALMQKLGVERRVFTAGNAKNRLDQYLPLRPEDAKKMDVMLRKVHDHFIQSVLSTRHSKLTQSAEALFTGDFWTGAEAVKLGLVDGIADLPGALAKEFGVEHTQDYTPVPNLFERFSGALTTSLRDFILTGAMSAQLH